MENEILETAENYRSNQSYGFKEIVLRQLQRVVTNASQEMRKGFWVYSHPSPNLSPEKIRYIGDSRKELKQSLDVLHDLLMPKFDEDISNKSKEIYEEFENWYAECKENAKQKDFDESDYWNTTLNIYRKLFQEICLFLERLGWLESSDVEE